MTSNYDNPDRAHLLLSTMGRAEDKSFDAVAALLPPDFDLLQIEWEEAADALARPEPVATAKPEPPDPEQAHNAGMPLPRTPKAQENFAFLHAAEPERPAERAPTPKISQRDARAAIEAAENRLGNARIAERTKGQEAANARGALARAIQSWQMHIDPATPEERRQREVRAHLAGEQARRAARVARPIPQVGNSYVDRSRAYRRGSDANDFARSQMQTGDRHGAYPANMRGRQVRLPSEQ
jgi:hypothetical protein